jgi:hypothetical protein
VADNAGWARLGAVMLASIAAMVVYLVIAHHLWERPADPQARERALLFNAVTVATLTIGVVSLYVVACVATFLLVQLVIDPAAVRSQLGHSPSLATYLAMAWMAGSLATVGGALGSGLESEESVRVAAYGYRPDEQAAQDRRT